MTQVWNKADENVLLDRAASGDAAAWTALMENAHTLAFNLSLRMLGSPHDAEDCAQEIMERVLGGFGGFRRESSFRTWVYRIAVNHALDYKKGMFAHVPLTFEFYGRDIMSRQDDSLSAGVGEGERAVLEEELKMGCTNVMLQCLAPESRCVFVLGAMFQVDSREAGEALGMSPEAYRQKLVRVRDKMALFLTEYCGLAGGLCRCSRRVGHALDTGRIAVGRREYTTLPRLDEAALRPSREAMEDLEDAVALFARMPRYGTPPESRGRLADLLASERFRTAMGTAAGPQA